MYNKPAMTRLVAILAAALTLAACASEKPALPQSSLSPTPTPTGCVSAASPYNPPRSQPPAPSPDPISVSPAQPTTEPEPEPAETECAVRLTVSDEPKETAPSLSSGPSLGSGELNPMTQSIAYAAPAWCAVAEGRLVYVNRYQACERKTIPVEIYRLVNGVPSPVPSAGWFIRSVNWVTRSRNNKQWTVYELTWPLPGRQWGDPTLINEGLIVGEYFDCQNCGLVTIRGVPAKVKMFNSAMRWQAQHDVYSDFPGDLLWPLSQVSLSIGHPRSFSERRYMKAMEHRCDNGGLPGYTNSACVFHRYIPRLKMRIGDPDVGKHAEFVNYAQHHIRRPYGAVWAKLPMTRAYSSTIVGFNRQWACPKSYPRPGSCDEYPYAASNQGAYMIGGWPNSMTRNVLYEHNREAGTRLSRMFVLARVIRMDKFYVVISP